MKFLDKSSIDMRDAFFNSLYEIIKIDKDVIVLTADHGAFGLNKIKEDFPNQYINMGIAEQNMASVASGLALSGKIVYIYSIINFVTLRCLEQINIDIASMNLHVNIIGVGTGFTYSTDGPTHHGTQDIAIMSALPNLSIYNCSDSVNTYTFAKLGYEKKGAKYFRIEKGVFPNLYIYDKNKFERGFEQIKKSKETIIISSGLMVQKSLNLLRSLEDEGYKVGLIDLYRLKPLNIKKLIDLIINVKNLLIIEDNIMSGGIGEKISSALFENNIQINVMKFSIKDQYLFKYNKSKDSLERYCGLDLISLKSHLKSLIKN